MYKETDFHVNIVQFKVKKDCYPVNKINRARAKKRSLISNLAEILFWIVIFSGAVWLVTVNFENAFKFLAIPLTILGLLFSLPRCSKYVLQIEFRHVDGTGVQWINVAKSYWKSDYALFQQQVVVLEERIKK